MVSSESWSCTFGPSSCWRPNSSRKLFYNGVFREHDFWPCLDVCLTYPDIAKLNQQPTWKILEDGIYPHMATRGKLMMNLMNKWISLWIWTFHPPTSMINGGFNKWTKPSWPINLMNKSKQQLIWCALWSCRRCYHTWNQSFSPQRCWLRSCRRLDVLNVVFWWNHERKAWESGGFLWISSILWENLRTWVTWHHLQQRVGPIIDGHDLQAFYLCDLGVPQSHKAWWVGNLTQKEAIIATAVTYGGF